MSKNTIVETTKNGQATNNIQTENTSKVPTGKIKTLKTAEARRKEHEERYENFRINALKRRCKRYGMSEEDTAKYVEKLREQLKAPKQYSILIMLNKEDGVMFNEAIAKAKIQYKYRGDTYFSIDGDQSVLAKLREIAPPSAKIYPYAKKMESVLAGVKPPEKKQKKPTNNTAERKSAAKKARKELNMKRGMHKKHETGRKMKKHISLAEHKKISKAATVQLKGKKGSKGSKMAKKAA